MVQLLGQRIAAGGTWRENDKAAHAGRICQFAAGGKGICLRINRLQTGLAFAYKKGMTLVLPTAAPAEGNSPYPTTASGKRNWSWKAVHGDVQKPSRETVPEYEGGGFADLLDIINPLQHIPIVSNIYRAVTGDTINPAGRILGGALFGGPVGFMAGIGGSLIAETTGKDVGEHLLAALTGDSSSATSSTSAQVASARYDAASRLRM